MHTAEDLFEMGRALEPLLGPAGPWVFGLGVFAAGLSSALTAPLAAGLTLAPWFPDRPRLPLAVSWCVMAVGLAFGLRAVLSTEGQGSPTQLILTAQVTNALLLPIALAFLWWMSRRPRLGRWRAGPLASTAGGAVVLLGFVLAIRTAMKIAG